jgi:hypothetical protein
MYKTFCVIAGFLLFAPLWLLAQSDLGPAAEKLAALRGSYRPLLIFYPQMADGRPLASMLQTQLSLLHRHGAELKERDVIVMLVPEEPAEQDASRFRGQRLRAQFGVEPKRFTVLLVGKDGGEKFRSHAPVTIEKLDALIDAMPMRQQEVRDGHAK